MRNLRLAFVGFGNVGRHFASRLPGDYGRILRREGLSVRMTGIATARHGIAVDPRGLKPAACVRRVAAGQSLQPLHRGRAVDSTLGFVRTVPADVLFEISPLDPRAGQPAIAHVEAALRRGLHVVTVNKGPVAFALKRLRALAARRRRAFLFEGAVLDGTPLFNLAFRCLPGCRIHGFRGVLNSTTTRILGRMEAGIPFADALREAQAAGVAEADPRNDVDGWDAAVKGCAIANALMGAAITPAQVDRTGIGGISVADLQAACAEGCRTRLVVRGRRDGPRVSVRVAPERVAGGDVLATSGSDGVVVLETDLMRDVAVWEGVGGVDQTAYALLADLIAIARKQGTR